MFAFNFQLCILTSFPRLKPHKCNGCSASFAKGSDLRRHALAVHRLSPQERLYVCRDCAIEFRLAFQLAMHVRAVHDAKTPMFECSDSACDAIFSTKQGYKKHMLKKHGQEPE
jgi:uncharacterized Zn-finger protein